MMCNSIKNTSVALRLTVVPGTVYTPLDSQIKLLDSLISDLRDFRFALLTGRDVDEYLSNCY